MGSTWFGEAQRWRSIILSVLRETKRKYDDQKYKQKCVFHGRNKHTWWLKIRFQFGK